jgi:hypothetical protein
MSDTHILKAGGALQAISAMAFRTASCSKVDKVCGAGNQFARRGPKDAGAARVLQKGHFSYQHQYTY